MSDTPITDPYYPDHAHTIGAPCLVCLLRGQLALTLAACDAIEQHGDRIFVRARNADGRWKNKALTELPTREALAKVVHWFRAGVVPIAFLDPDKSEP